MVAAAGVLPTDVLAVGDLAGPATCVAALLLCGAAPTVRYLRIFSSFFGPIPRIACRSFTLLNLP